LAGAAEIPDVGAADTADFTTAGSGEGDAVWPDADKLLPDSQTRRAVFPDAACEPADTAGAASASFSNAAKSAPCKAESGLAGAAAARGDAVTTKEAIKATP
jgi:hypothetical protein